MSILRPRFILFGGIIVVAILLVSLAQEMNRRWQIQREVQQLDAQVRDAEKTTIELENLNQYFRTDDFQERLAREKLNYQAPGEKLILIPAGEEPVDEAAQAEEEERLRPNPEKWWRLFFVDETT